jgi:hypothetical protein
MTATTRIQLVWWVNNWLIPDRSGGFSRHYALSKGSPTGIENGELRMAN